MLTSQYELFNGIVNYYTHNTNSTLGENDIYFMYKYNFTHYDWNQNINNNYKLICM